MRQRQEPESSADSKYSVDAVVRACDILAAFRDSSETLDLRQVSERSGVKKATAFRILSTLVSKRLIEKLGSRAYRCRFKPLRRTPFLIGYAAQSEVIPFIATVTESLVAPASWLPADWKAPAITWKVIQTPNAE